MMKKTNFDEFLDDQLKDREFAVRFEQSGEAWNIAIQFPVGEHSPEFHSVDSVVCNSARSFAQ